MERRKLGNVKQLVSAYELELKDGASYGKKCVLVNNGALEVMFNADNALDIAWIKYHGQNISFLSKNGINSNVGPFREKFEGGFLYTCGIDNVSGCEKDQAIHGSLHYRKAENIGYAINDEKVEVFGTIRTTALFGQNLTMKRVYTVLPDKVEINDTIVNDGFVDASYVVLYHINFGYPFLDTGMRLEFDEIETIPANGKSLVKDCKIIIDPEDEGSEDLYYQILKKGEVTLTNEKLGISCKMEYDKEKLPYLVEWRNLFSGDYVLGIEPSTVRFDEYKKLPLSAGEEVSFEISLSFNKF